MEGIFKQELMNTPTQLQRRNTHGIQVIGGSRQQLSSNHTSGSSSERPPRGITLTSLSREKKNTSSGGSSSRNVEGTDRSDRTAQTPTDINPVSMEGRHHRAPSHSMHTLSGPHHTSFQQTIAEQQLQIEQLKGVLLDNDTKISNLIETLNHLMQRAGRREVLFEKLMVRVRSIEQHQNQCYDYSMRRVGDAELRMGGWGEEVIRQTAKVVQLANRVDNVQWVARDVFEAGRSRWWAGVERSEKERVIVKEELGELRRRIEEVERGEEQEGGLRGDLVIRLSTLTDKVGQLEEAHRELSMSYNAAQCKSKQAVYQLSTLLHMHERQLEQLKQQNKQLNTLIILLKSQLTSYKQYPQPLNPTYTQQQFNLTQQQRDKYKQMYSEIFQLNERLQQQRLILSHNLNSISIRNQILIKEKQDLEQKVQQLKGQPINKLKELTQQLTQMHSLLAQKELELWQGKKKGEEIAGEGQELRTKLEQVEREYQEEQQYSAHLQRQNEALEGKINEYTQQFKQQSQMFRGTIQQLTAEKQQLQQALRS